MLSPGAGGSFSWGCTRRKAPSKPILLFVRKFALRAASPMRPLTLRMALREATGGQAPVFEGSGGISLVDSYRRGIVGTMPGADLVDAIVALWQALEAGDEQRIYRLSLPISSLIAIQTSLDAFLVVEKYLLVKRGIFKNTVVRGPVGFRLDDETRSEVDRLFEQLMTVLNESQLP